MPIILNIEYLGFLMDAVTGNIHLLCYKNRKKAEVI
jgi:hypothetical protein